MDEVVALRHSTVLIVAAKGVLDDGLGNEVFFAINDCHGPRRRLCTGRAVVALEKGDVKHWMDLEVLGKL